MSHPRRNHLSPWSLLPFLFLVATAGCGLGQAPDAEPSPSYCDGVSTEVGGCDADRPTFTGRTCSEVAKEFGLQLDRRLVEIHTGPDSATASKAVRAGHYTSVAASLANLQLRRAGQIKECSAGAFVNEAESVFSSELRAHAGELLHDGDPVTYLAWRKTIVDMMSIIDMEEDAPLPSA